VMLKGSVLDRLVGVTAASVLDPIAAVVPIASCAVTLLAVARMSVTVMPVDGVNESALTVARFCPLIVNVMPLSPCAPVLGLTEEMVGPAGAAFTVNDRSETSSPHSRLRTRRCATWPAGPSQRADTIETAHPARARPSPSSAVKRSPLPSGTQRRRTRASFRGRPRPAVGVARPQLATRMARGARARPATARARTAWRG